MRFNEFNEGIDPSAKAAIKGMRELSGDQYYGLYKTMKDVAGHDGEKQTAPEGATDHEVSDKPFAYAYTDEEKNMIKGVDPKAKQLTSDKSEELDESQLDEIDRRGFLKGMGAAAVAGAAGGAMGQQKSKLDLERERNMAIANAQPYTGPTVGYQGDNKVRKHHPDSEIKFLDYNTLRAAGDELGLGNTTKTSARTGAKDANPNWIDGKDSGSRLARELVWAFQTSWVYNGKGKYINFNIIKPGSKLERQGYKNYAEILPEKIILDELRREVASRKSNQQNYKSLAKNSGLLDSVEQGVAEAGNNYHANRTGFARPSGQRDDERHDLDAPRPTIYALKINGKIWQKDGNTVTFFTRERALAARNSILAKRPDVEVGLVQRQD